MNEQQLDFNSAIQHSSMVNQNAQRQWKLPLSFQKKKKKDSKAVNHLIALLHRHCFCGLFVSVNPTMKREKGIFELYTGSIAVGLHNNFL